jgi:hypothetical protein
MIKWTVLIIFGIWTFGVINSQNLSSHQWKDRLLLIYDHDRNSLIMQSQLDELLSDQTGLTERKLIVYQMTPDSYRLPSRNERWHPLGEFNNQIDWNSSRFEVILVGLDGGIKVRRSEVIYLDELFDIIDSMPMRISEIKGNN